MAMRRRITDGYPLLTLAWIIAILALAWASWVVVDGARSYWETMQEYDNRPRIERDERGHRRD